MRINNKELNVRFAEKPIDFKYDQPTEGEINAIKSADTVSIILETENIKPMSSYFYDNYKGASLEMTAREAVYSRIKKLAKILAPDYGFMIYDAFRTIETQAAIFDFMAGQVREQHPEWTEEEVDLEARNFAAHPYDRSYHPVAPHNSGGAIDLVIYETETGQACDFGSAFDEVSQVSYTDFFESPFDPKVGFSEETWTNYQANRRILYHLMVSVGFTNFSHEWWHFDLGDCNWSRQLGVNWYFDSME